MFSLDAKAVIDKQLEKSRVGEAAFSKNRCFKN